MRRIVGVTAAVSLLAAAAALAGGGAGPARADHLETWLAPAEPSRAFPAGFEALLPVDSQSRNAVSSWKDPRVGGWGAGTEACGVAPSGRTPVVFVHGNSMDASFWRTADSGDGTIVDVRRRFLAAGYCPEDLWAVSYTGAAGYTTYNDVNTGDVRGFVAAVRQWTGAAQVDVVAHSLGVTVVRKAALLDPDFQASLRSFVAIAGANQGTTACRGSGTLHVSHVCEETEPGSAWLAELNAGGQTPGATRYLTIYEGSGFVDNFFLGPDAQSPRLDGACNHQMPGVAHNTLARGATAVATYLAFLRDGTLPACS